MANTNMDNYIDSLENGDTIEYEGEKLIFDKIEDNLIVCKENDFFEVTYIFIQDFHDELEFWENHIFGQYVHDTKIDNEVDLAINQNK